MGSSSKVKEKLSKSLTGCQRQLVVEAGGSLITFFFVSLCWRSLKERHHQDKVVL